MAMTENQLSLVGAIAQNKLSEAKKYALACCEEDTTQKNRPYVARYKRLLESEPNMMEMPYNISGMAQMEDVSSFRPDRYYLSSREAEIFEKIAQMNNASLKLMEMGIPYLNAILLTGESGTGKTTFGRYVAYKLNLPFLYINFSSLVDSKMGQTSQNLRLVMEYARLNKCLLMLDEIDCIAQKRSGASEGATREFNNTTISLMQELDRVKNDSIIIGATNIADAIDAAVLRRFSLHHEVKPLMHNEALKLVTQYIESVGMKYDSEDTAKYIEKIYEPHNGKYILPTQAKIIKHIISRIADAVLNENDMIELSKGN